MRMGSIAGRWAVELSSVALSLPNGAKEDVGCSGCPPSAVRQVPGDVWTQGGRALLRSLSRFDQPVRQAQGPEHCRGTQGPEPVERATQSNFRIAEAGLPVRRVRHANRRQAQGNFPSRGGIARLRSLSASFDVAAFALRRLACQAVAPQERRLVHPEGVEPPTSRFVEKLG